MKSFPLQLILKHEIQSSSIIENIFFKKVYQLHQKFHEIISICYGIFKKDEILFNAMWPFEFKCVVVDAWEDKTIPFLGVMIERWWYEKANMKGTKSCQVGNHMIHNHAQKTLPYHLQYLVIGILVFVEWVIGEWVDWQNIDFDKIKKRLWSCGFFKYGLCHNSSFEIKTNVCSRIGISS